MRVHVYEDIYLSGDKMGYAVEKKVIGTDKETQEEKVSYTPQSYHVSIASAVKWLTKYKVADSTATTIQELLDEIKAHHAKIEATVGAW